MESINDRIEKIINQYFNENKASFAKTIGLPPTGLSNYLGKKRRSKPSVDMIVKIIKNVEVDPRWLLLGDENTLTPSVHTQGAYSPASLTGNINVIKDIEIKDDSNYDSLKKENEKLLFEIEYLKKLIAEKDKNIQEKERLISFLTSSQK